MNIYEFPSIFVYFCYLVVLLISTENRNRNLYPVFHLFLYMVCKVWHPVANSIHFNYNKGFTYIIDATDSYTLTVKFCNSKFSFKGPRKWWEIEMEILLIFWIITLWLSWNISIIFKAEFKLDCCCHNNYILLRTCISSHPWTNRQRWVKRIYSVLDSNCKMLEKFGTTFFFLTFWKWFLKIINALYLLYLYFLLNTSPDWNNTLTFHKTNTNLTCYNTSHNDSHKSQLH